MPVHDNVGEGLVSVDDGSNAHSTIESAVRQPRIVDAVVNASITLVTVGGQALGLRPRTIAFHLHLSLSPAPFNNSGGITWKAAMICSYGVGRRWEAALAI
jgi:hypothetical protein